MSNDDEKIPVATVAVEDEADRAPPDPVKIGRAYLTVPVLLTKNLFDSTPAAFCGC